MAATILFVGAGRTGANSKRAISSVKLDPNFRPKLHGCLTTNGHELTRTTNQSGAVSHGLFTDHRMPDHFTSLRLDLIGPKKQPCGQRIDGNGHDEK
jgi:hypothetical protein